MSSIVDMISKRARAIDGSLLCVGIDPTYELIRRLDRNMSMLDYCTGLVDATHKYACAFKPQIAHFAGAREEKTLEDLVRYIKASYPSVPVILDAKRGDIDTTALHYVTEAFERYQVDAVTVNPYLGIDSVQPFFDYGKGKGIIVLVRTSNPGAKDIQDVTLANGQPLYRYIASYYAERFSPDRLLFVVGGTYPEHIQELREQFPQTFFLVPGVGFQGGSIERVLGGGLMKDAPLGVLVSVSRGIAGVKGTQTPYDYFQAAEERAKQYCSRIRGAIATRT